MPRLIAAYPISDEDLAALPVKAIGPAVDYYQKVLRFAVARRVDDAATVERDGVKLGVVADTHHDPGKAGSIAIRVDDLEELHRELVKAGAKPGEFGVDEWDGKAHRTFFVREAENGYCYCFFAPV